MDNTISSINLKIVSLNVRGLNNSTIRRKIFKWLHKQSAHCYFLQETFSTEQNIDIWRSEWGEYFFYSHGSNHSKGVMILVNPAYQIEVIKSVKDKKGRSIVLEINLDNHPAYPIERSVIEHNRTHNKIWSIEQNRTFDYRTVDNRTKSNVRLPNSRQSYSVERSITELLFVYIAGILYGALSPWLVLCDLL